MKLHFLLLCTLVAFNDLKSQTPIPLPTFRETVLDSLEKVWYYQRIPHLQDYNNIVFHPDKYSWWDVTGAYYNRYNMYYSLLTDNPEDILYIFFDAINNDRADFCSKLKLVKQQNGQCCIHEKSYYKREGQIMDKVCECVYLSFNKKLIDKLNIMKENDLKYRENETTDWKKQFVLDSVNQIMAKEIFADYGYPNRNLVGVEYESVFFYVIQHSSLPMMEKFLPIIKNEIDNKRLDPQFYPLLHDRVNMLNGKPQEFGTQTVKNSKGVFELYKSVDIKTVNKNRKKYALKEM